jgi:dihydrofolate reductase
MVSAAGVNRARQGVFDMRKLVVTENVSLDGVMQAPGRPDEDRRGGFELGGWARAYRDADLAAAMAPRMKTAGPLLFGRRTYEDFFSVWPKRTDGNPYTDVLNNAQKYVASTTLREPLPWQNSTLLAGDVAAAVTALKQQPGKDIGVLGSGELVRTLMRHHLVDAFVLLIHPLTLGAGRRLFEPPAASAAFTLAGTTSTGAGVVIATYHARS